MQRASRRAVQLLARWQQLSCSGALSATPAGEALAAAPLHWTAAPPLPAAARLSTQQQQQHQQHHSRRAFSSSLAPNDDALRERRLVAARQRAQRAQRAQQQRASAVVPSHPPSPPSTYGDANSTSGDYGSSSANNGLSVPEGALLPSAEYDLPNAPAVSRALNHPALIITREIEWLQVITGYEQATKYTVRDEHGTVVALMAEETGVLNFVARQTLHTHRPFKTTVFSPEGEVLFSVTRPFYLVSSSMTINDAEGDPIGLVQQRWHLWKRNYDIYLGHRQVAAISGNLLAWEFELKDEKGHTLALIDRNFQGFGKELFTDAGKYVIHFGFAPQRAAEIAHATVVARSGKAEADVPAVTPMAVARTGVAVIPTISGNQLAVQRPLALDERMLALATAVSIDYNYFSRHSHGAGFITPPLIMPMPMPAEGAAEGAAAGDGGGAAAADGAAGTAGAGEVGSGSSGGGGSGIGEEGAFGDPGFGQQAPPGGGDDSAGWTWDGGSGDGGSGGDDGEGAAGVFGVVKDIWDSLGGGE